MADYDMSDVSVSESWADAQADTPTMGEGNSGSEDTLSNLSFDNGLDNQQELPFDGADSHGQAQNTHLSGEGAGEQSTSGIINPPVAAPRNSRQLKQPNLISPLDDKQMKSGNVENSTVKVCITDADIDMDSSIHLPPGAEYVPSILDLPKSPSQLKIIKGAGFLPTEESGAISEDESSISSSAALLDIDLQNGDVRLKKKAANGNELKKPNFILPSIVLESNDHNGAADESIQAIEDSDVLDDYIEDFILPLSNESVMSRQLSFRRKVQKQLETAAAERAVQELDRFEAMLSTYDEEDEYDIEMNNDSDDGGSILRVNNIRKNNGKMSANSRNTNGFPSGSVPNGSSDTVLPPVPKARGKAIQRNGDSDMFFNNENGSNDAYNKYGTPNGFVDGVNFGVDSDFETISGAPSLSLDIDAIVKENAPNLMGRNPIIDVIPEHGPEESMSSYFIPQPTLDKLYAAYESSNFNNIYCLSGELKDILTPNEIEEIVANKDHLEKFIDPNVMAALSWSINETSLPYMPHGTNNNSSLNLDQSLEKQNKLNSERLSESRQQGDADRTDIIENGLKTGSKSSSLSNGFHSDASASEDDLQSNEDAVSTSSRLEVPNNVSNNDSCSKKMVPVKDKYSESSEISEQGLLSPSPIGDLDNQPSLQRGTVLSNSLRRKISPGRDTPKSPSRICHSPDGSSSVRRGNSQESLDTDLGVGEDDWDDEEDDTRSKKSSSSGVVLVRRDSKRFSFKGKDGQKERIVQGLFVESKNPNPNGTLRRIRAPLNLTEDIGDDGLDSPDGPSLVDIIDQDAAKGPKVHKKRISVDDKILSVISTDLDDNSAATDVTQSDVFHSFINTLRDDEDPTIKSDEDDADDITLDIDTPDDMEDSILEQLDSLSTQPRDIIKEYSAEEELEEARRWKSFKVGPTDIQIDLKAIHPYRRVLSHGGYFDAEKNIAIILFSGCYLPDRTRKEYTYLMDHLFLYVLSTLEELVVDDYILVYLHGACCKSCVPSFSWLKRCYQLIDRRLKKNLKALYLVHPTFWLRTVVALTKPFVSTKFSKKVQFINTLSDLCLEIPTEHLVIPDRVLQYDFDLKVDDLKRRKIMS